MTERPTRSIEIEKEVDATPDAVWEAITTDEGLRRWFPLDAKVEAGEGGSVWLSWGPGCEGEAPIHMWDPGRRFGWTESYGDDAVGRPIRVAVDFHIEGREGTTVVRLVQSGLSANADWDEMYDALVDGWTYFMFNLGHCFQEHPGRARRMAWARVPTTLDRHGTWDRLAAAGLVSGHEESTTDARPTVNLGQLHQARIVSVRPGHHFAAVLPHLEDSVFFVEIEEKNVGFWLSTYALAAPDVEALQASLEQRVEAALATG
jgi:uncharacterized protein YndB with AHSA1/START domain